MSQISVIIPAYNAASTIVAAVESALSQQRVQVEVLVVDDGSEDETYNCLSQFANRIKLIKQTHQGRSVARNIGLQAASASYVAFLDADDIWLDTKLHTQLGYLRQYPQAVLTYSRALLMNQESIPVKPAIQIGGGQAGLKQVFDDLLEGNMVPLLTVLARIEPVLLAGGFNPDLHYLEDWDLWIRMARFGPFHFSDVCLANYRTYGISRLAKIECSEDTVEQLISIPYRYAGGDKAKKASLFIYVKSAVYSSLLGNHILAKNYLTKAASIDPGLTRSELLADISDIGKLLSIDQLWQLQQDCHCLLYG